MREELAKLRSETDISETEAERYAHYQPLTLEDPDEVWIDETETGERHFTFVSHFRHGETRLSFVVVCLAIEGAPSFVFLSFPTWDEDLVDEYRRGIDLKINDDTPEAPEKAPDIEPEPRLAPGLTEDATSALESEEQPVAVEPNSEVERLYHDLRQAGDISLADFPKYEPYIEATIEDADEIWRFIDDEGNEWFTFISRHSVETGDLDDFTMVAVCEPVCDESTGAKSFEVVFAFPTTDGGLVQHFRKGINSLNKAFGVGWTRGRAA